MSFATIDDVLARGVPRNDMTRDARLMEAYTAFAEGRASRDDADLVLVDLAVHSGYFHVSERGSTGTEMAYDAGARSVFARIMFMLNLPMDRIADLQRALTATTPLYTQPYQQE